MAPSIAARRVDGVQGARCPKGSAEMAALSRGTNLIWGVGMPRDSKGLGCRSYPCSWAAPDMTFLRVHRPMGLTSRCHSTRCGRDDGHSRAANR